MPILQTNSLCIGSDDTVSAQPEQPSILLLHSCGAGRRQWRTLIEALAPNWRCVAPDLLGYGQSASVASRPYGLELEIELAAALFDDIGGRAHLIGYCFGGSVSLGLAATRPEMLASLTLFEPVRFDLLLGLDKDLHRQITNLARAHVEACRNGQQEMAAAAFVNHGNGAAAWEHTPPDVQAKIAAAMPKVGLEWSLLLEPDAIRPVAVPDVPVLPIEGRKTTTAAAAVMQTLAQSIPSAACASIKGANHLVPTTHAAETAEMIGCFLARSVASGRNLERTAGSDAAKVN